MKLRKAHQINQLMINYYAMKRVVILKAERGDNLYANWSLDGASFNLFQIFNLLISQEPIDIFEVLLYTLVAKLEYFGCQSIEKIPVVGNEN